MKIKNLIRISFVFIACFVVLAACTKSSATKTATINGNWLTPTWGAAGDTAIISISTTAGIGTIIGLNTQAATATGFSLNEVIFSAIMATSNGTYTAVGEFRYGTGNQTVGHANCSMALQNNNTVLYVHYSKDPTSGITPPDYYWQKSTQ